MIGLALLLALAQPQEGPWTKYQGPFKLIITWHGSNLTVIDYPSFQRCDLARQAVAAEAERRQRASDAAMPAGSVRIGTSPNGAFCIPGKTHPQNHLR